MGSVIEKVKSEKPIWVTVDWAAAFALAAGQSLLKTRRPLQVRLMIG
jgi:hypothetical protein